MLLKKSWNGKENSQFVCDRCGKLIPPWYKYGLCPKCNEEMDESNIIPWFEEFIGLRR